MNIHFFWCHAQHRRTKYSCEWKLFGAKLAQLLIHVCHRPQSSVEKCDSKSIVHRKHGKSHDVKTKERVCLVKLQRRSNADHCK